MSLILLLDAAGAPTRWIGPEQAAFYYAKGLVSWDLGESAHVLRGGTNAKTGLRTELAVRPIIAVAGREFIVGPYRPIPVERSLVFRRDRCLCAYCGDVFREGDLTLDHVIPGSRGGKSTWLNLVAACKACNGRKANRTPEEAKMALLYVPYVPNRHESIILQNRRVTGDQMEFLLAGVPRHSRLHA